MTQRQPRLTSAGSGITEWASGCATVELAFPIGLGVGLGSGSKKRVTQQRRCACDTGRCELFRISRGAPPLEAEAD